MEESIIIDPIKFKELNFRGKKIDTYVVNGNAYWAIRELGDSIGFDVNGFMLELFILGSSDFEEDLHYGLAGNKVSVLTAEGICLLLEKRLSRLNLEERTFVNDLLCAALEMQEQHKEELECRSWAVENTTSFNN